ncbi:response regulator [Nodosilinea sp. E11]|uniref:ATP-binding response regulator n=1 Tax=Nodosilinea sp. E11 TaxID=3037479 RepID=UPI0029352F17|nr:response regulator [Nodosilinea sp. E11]WOD40278.1 response regulator [Nodosilinea sp. E11]
MTKILIIEDEPSVLDNLQDILTLENYAVVIAHNGRQGVEAALEHRPDLILCDVMMPEMDGFEVVKVLRETPTTQTIPFIFLTAKADRLDQREGMDLGADDYLTKPFRPQEVLRAIRTRLERNAALMQPYRDEAERAKTLTQQLHDNTELATMQENLLSKLSEDLREPLGNVNLALHMLGQAKTEADRDRYINVLKQEYAREIRLLKDVANLQEMLTPDNLKVLRQFNLLQNNG